MIYNIGMFCPKKSFAIILDGYYFCGSIICHLRVGSISSVNGTGHSVTYQQITATAADFWEAFVWKKKTKKFEISFKSRVSTELIISYLWNSGDSFPGVGQRSVN